MQLFCCGIIGGQSGSGLGSTWALGPSHGPGAACTALLGMTGMQASRLQIQGRWTQPPVHLLLMALKRLLQHTAAVCSPRGNGAGVEAAGSPPAALPPAAAHRQHAQDSWAQNHSWAHIQLAIVQIRFMLPP